MQPVRQGLSIRVGQTLVGYFGQIFLTLIKDSESNKGLGHTFLERKYSVYMHNSMSLAGRLWTACGDPAFSRGAEPCAGFCTGSPGIKGY